MATTTQITNIADKLDLTDYAGDFIGDYDMDAVHAEYVERINRYLPSGVSLANNGEVFADIEVADLAREINWDLFLDEEITADDIFERHDRTARLLPAVAQTTEVAARTDRARVTAVRAAKDSGRFTVEEIAQAARITRDGVYKMLRSTTRTITFSTPGQAQHFARLPELAGNGHDAEVDGVTAALDTAALAVLADFDEHDDFHFDGTHVWVGGTEYRVEG
jgi:phage terminase small subunit